MKFILTASDTPNISLDSLGEIAFGVLGIFGRMLMPKSKAVRMGTASGAMPIFASISLSKGGKFIDFEN
jgi:hypothetical protein